MNQFQQSSNNQSGIGVVSPVALEGNSRGIGFLTGQRDKKAFQKAHTHSGFVRFLRIFFPIVGVLMIAGIGATYYWHSIGKPVVQVESTSFNDDKMVMKNPVLKGLDSNNRPYELLAKEAIQNTKNMTEIELNEIDAHVPMDEKTYAKILAGTGLYNSEAKTLILGGEVDLVTDDGMTIKLQDADIDIGAGNMFTNNPVIMNSPQAEIRADSVAIEDNGDSIIFNKNVKMTLYPNKIKSAQNAAQ